MAEVPQDFVQGTGESRVHWMALAIHTWALLALAMADIMALWQQSSSLASWVACKSTARCSCSLSISTQRNMVKALYWLAAFLVHSFSHLFSKLCGCMCMYVSEGGNVLIGGMCGRRYSLGPGITKVTATRISQVPH